MHQEKTETNAAGGKQSALNTRCDLLPPAALLKVAEVLKRGSHYGRDNWRLIPQSDHINHALTHLFMHLTGDTIETHLANAACRLLFALETDDDGAAGKVEPAPKLPPTLSDGAAATPRFNVAWLQRGVATAETASVGRHPFLRWLPDGRPGGSRDRG